MNPLTEPLVDIGVNLTSKQFRNDLPQVIERALTADVRYLIVTGLTAPLSQAALELARSRPKNLCSTAGVHPHNARTFDRHTQDELRALARAARGRGGRRVRPRLRSRLLTAPAATEGFRGAARARDRAAEAGIFAPEERA